MNIMKKGLITIGLLVSLGSYAQDVKTYAPNAQEEGIVYYLPKTQLDVKVVAHKITYTPGELCQYANRYLKLQDVVTQPKEYWEIQSITVQPVGIPDENKAYRIKLKDKMVTSQVELTEDGIIKAINTTYPTETVTPPSVKSTEVKRVDPRNYMTEEMLLAGSTSKMAELIAKEIYNIRESKNSLTRGQADYMPQDGAALKIMLDNLNTQEKALTEMFTGYTEYSSQTYTFQVEPEQDIKDQVIFRLSNKLGVLHADNLAGEPFYLSIINKNPLPPTTEEENNKKIVGVIYNIPGKAIVSIKGNGKKYIEEEFAITQFGETEVLTNSLFNKKINTRVIFNPITGGIMKIDKD